MNNIIQIDEAQKRVGINPINSGTQIIIKGQNFCYKYPI